jgi:hypothetical protein
MKSQKTNENNFTLMNIGGTIRPQQAGDPYELINGQVYKLDYAKKSQNPFLTNNDELVLQEIGDLKVPDPVINSRETQTFVERVVRSHTESTRATTGVLLNGLKGSGKTVDANQIAILSGLPIILLGKHADMSDLYYFFKHVRRNICIIADEIDKHTNQMEGMYELMDGSEEGFRKLIIMTANSVTKMDTNLMNRPGRVRYFRTYTEISPYYLKGIVKESGIHDPDEIIEQFIKSYFDIGSLDVIKAFIDEVKVFGTGKKITEAGLYRLVKQMNIELKGQNKFRDVIKTKRDSGEFLNQLMEIVNGSQISEKQHQILADKIDDVRTTLKGYDVLKEITIPEEDPYMDFEEECDF